MISRVFSKQQKLFLVIVVECVHTILFSIYLFKQMGATFTDDRKIYAQKKISLMYSPVCDFSGSSTKCWISAHTWSCGHGYRLRVPCTVGLPVPKCMSGIARVLCLTEPGCGHRARLQELRVSVCFPKLVVPLREGYQRCLRYQVELPSPDSCASSATVAVCLCLWGCASTDMSSGPAGSCVLVGGMCRQLLKSPECSWELRDLQGLLCFPVGLHKSPNGYWWCSAVSHICAMHLP